MIDTSLLTDPYRRRWLGWGLLASAFFLVSLHRNATAVLSGRLADAFGTTAVGLGLLHSSFFYLYAFLQVPAGLLTDRYGARKIAATGTGLMSVGALTVGAAPTFAVAFLGRLLSGLGASVLFVTVLRFCANWFRADEFGTLTGVTFSVSILGGLAATTPLALAVDAAGWRRTLSGLGVAGVAIAIGVFVLSHDSPADAGLDPVQDVPARPDVTAADLKRNFLGAVSELETWLLGGMLFFVTGIGITVYGLWGIPYLVHTYDLSVTEASVFLAIGSVGGLIGPTVFGWLSDRFGSRTGLIVVSITVASPMWGAFALFETIPLVLVAAVLLFSQLAGGGTALAYTVIAERHPGRASGTVIGLINTMGWIGAAVFPILLGAVLDIFWTGETVGGARVYTTTGYRVAFAIAVGAGLAAAACAVALHLRTTADPA